MNWLRLSPSRLGIVQTWFGLCARCSVDWQNHALIRLIIPFTLGMIGANLFISHMNMVVLFILCCAVLAFSFFLMKPSIQHDAKFGIVAMVLFFLIGMMLYTGKYQRIANSIPTDTTFCRGILTERPKEKAQSWALKLEQENGTHLLLYIGKNWEAPEQDSTTFASLQIGDTILANIRHLNATNLCEDKTFKIYNTNLFHQGICATAYTPHYQWLVRPCQTERTFLTSVKALHERLHDIYDDHGINGEAGSIIEAMTIGRKANLSSDTRNAYANAGISHILALSGFHVGIIVLMIQFFFLKNIMSFRWQWISNLLIIATLWCYALLTGMSPSLVRATTMFTILLLCQSFSRENIGINSCAFAFFFMLCINPFYLHNIGFQLSFIAVGGICLYAQRITHSCPTHNPLIRFFWSLIFITFICALFTAPLVAYYFGKFTLISLVSNLIIFPFVYLLIGASILWWVFLWCEPINNVLTDLLNWTANTLNSIVERLSSLPFATIEWHPNIFTTLICYVLLLVLSYFFLERFDFTFRQTKKARTSIITATTPKAMNAQTVSHQYASQ
jgi:competence protein ComEC